MRIDAHEEHVVCEEHHGEVEGLSVLHEDGSDLYDENVEGGEGERGRVRVHE